MKQFAIYLQMVFLGIVSLCLCACASSPSDNVVTSKNDGSFDAGIIESADKEHSPYDTQSIAYTDSFFSTDNSVEFQMNINEVVTAANLPVVKVAPHYLTEEDCQRIAKVLFGDAVFYEAEPALGELQDTLTREDVQASIQRWLPYTSEYALTGLFSQFAEQPEMLSLLLTRIKSDVAHYTELMTLIPEDRTHTPAKWQFLPELQYTYSEEDIITLDLDMSQCNDQICVNTQKNGIPYLLKFTVRNQDDFKLNSIFVYPNSNYSPMAIDANIFRAKLCGTNKPTEDQVTAVKEKAQRMLDDMNLGTWLVDECYVETENVGTDPLYVINVRAVPVFHSIPAIRRPQLDNLKSENNYASNYYLTDAIFQFNANGELVYFQLSSPIDISETVNSNTATLDMDLLIEKAKNYFMLSDYQQYGISGTYLEQAQLSAGEDYVCRVNLCELHYGMIRVKAPNTDDSYYYVPGIVVSGTIDYYGKESGYLYETSGDTIWNERIVSLLALNAVDGSVIELYND